MTEPRASVNRFGLLVCATRWATGAPDGVRMMSVAEPLDGRLAL
jgi:hypothetical protein